MRITKIHSGFTIVELLIVIVVIAVLAAISVVAYTGIQNRANDSVVESDLKTVAKKLELYKIDNNGNYPVSAQLDAVDIKISTKSYYAISSRANFYYCIDSASPSTYAIGAISASKQGYYMINGTITDSATDSSALLWGSTTCSQISLTQGNPGIESVSAWTGSAWTSWAL